MTAVAFAAYQAARALRYLRGNLVIWIRDTLFFPFKYTAIPLVLLASIGNRLGSNMVPPLFYRIVLFIPALFGVLFCIALIEEAVLRREAFAILCEGDYMDDTQLRKAKEVLGAASIGHFSHKFPDKGERSRRKNYTEPY